MLGGDARGGIGGGGGRAAGHHPRQETLGRRLVNPTTARLVVGVRRARRCPPGGCPQPARDQTRGRGQTTNRRRRVQRHPRERGKTRRRRTMATTLGYPRTS